MYLLFGLILVQYQNCAPRGENFAEESELTQPNVIDNVSVGEISFPVTKVSAFMDQNVSVVGVCEQSGSLISWTLSDASGEHIERGLAECDLGSFEVALSDEWQNFCGETLNLKAALGAKSSSVMQVEANCN